MMEEARAALTSWARRYVRKPQLRRTGGGARQFPGVSGLPPRGQLLPHGVYAATPSRWSTSSLSRRQLVGGMDVSLKRVHVADVVDAIVGVGHGDELQTPGFIHSIFENTTRST